MTTSLVLVRHGETDWNRERRFQGHADRSLNDAGREQARALAVLLSDELFAAIYTSPLRRASETADIVGRHLGLEPGGLEGLREIDVGGWEGLTIDEIRERFPEASRVDWRSGWEGGETYDELAARVIPALVDVAGRHPGESVLGITHAGPIRAALAAAEGISHEESRARIGPLENCATFRFEIRDGTLARIA